MQFNEIGQLINQYLTYIILGQSLLIFMLLILFFTTMNRTKKMRNTLLSLKKAKPPREQESETHNKHYDLLNEKLSFALQHMAIVRYNAFENTGSDLSFSVALLDGRGDGFVLSSLYGRDEARTFAKPIRGGRSDYQLSPEETTAIAKALER